MRPKNKSEKKASEAMFFHMRTCRSLAFSGIVNIRFENAQRKQEMGRYDGRSAVFSGLHIVHYGLRHDKKT
jgi:hypothetical protein